jgi:hypothetical protein
MTPAPCIAPPALPCSPECRGWLLRGPVLHGCLSCDEWLDDGEVVLHMDFCAGCRDLAVIRGAFEPVHRLYDGLQFTRTEKGWTASVLIRNKTIITTAVYPSRADAAEAGLAWLARLRAHP